ncbi:N-acetyltransferase GCN5 [Caballeronia humi]|uniref:N-acetyltransferase GCN5 n=2 Tax=Caballeronia humi TaxID=326474 RepID=A0A158GUV1_9BURK|nr:N-acetyltransferase GCN5 [Caballeronia humi]
MMPPGPRSNMTDHLSRFDWRWKHFNDLSAMEVYDMLAARSAVFIVEQDCLYNDIDGLDIDAWHLLVYGEGDKRPELAAYLRVLLPGQWDRSETDIRIGRVLTTAGYRGLKLGNAMLERVLGQIVAQWPQQPIRLHAQAHLQKFYGAFGFEPISDVHDEDGILHVWMRRS